MSRHLGNFLEKCSWARPKFPDMWHLKSSLALFSQSKPKLTLTAIDGCLWPWGTSSVTDLVHNFSSISVIHGQTKCLGTLTHKVHLTMAIDSPRILENLSKTAVSVITKIYRCVTKLHQISHTLSLWLKSTKMKILLWCLWGCPMAARRILQPAWTLLILESFSIDCCDTSQCWMWVDPPDCNSLHDTDVTGHCWSGSPNDFHKSGLLENLTDQYHWRQT